MNNLDWLCENDREQLMKLLAEGDSCEYCALEIEDDCGVRCNEGVRAWLEAEYSDGSTPENGVSDPDGGSNVAYIAQDTREKLEEDVRSKLTNVGTGLYSTVCADLPIVLGWLDRQAAITERESDKLYREKVKLTVERDSLETRLSNCQYRIRQLEAERDEAVEAYDAHMAAHDAWHEPEDITYTRNRFSVLEKAKNETIAKLTAEREALRKKLGEAISHAQAIAGLTEVDR